MTRAEARKVFRRNYGAAAQVARELNVTHVTISLWLRGRFKSERVEHAVLRRASELAASNFGSPQKPQGD
jgi:transcriptional regulator with XRE-family HTH domain